MPRRSLTHASSRCRESLLISTVHLEYWSITQIGQYDGISTYLSAHIGPQCWLKAVTLPVAGAIILTSAAVSSSACLEDICHFASFFPMEATSKFHPLFLQVGTRYHDSPSSSLFYSSRKSRLSERHPIDTRSHALSWAMWEPCAPAGALLVHSLSLWNPGTAIQPLTSVSDVLARST